MSNQSYSFSRERERGNERGNERGTNARDREYKGGRGGSERAPRERQRERGYLRLQLDPCEYG